MIRWMVDVGEWTYGGSSTGSIAGGIAERRYSLGRRRTLGPWTDGLFREAVAALEAQGGTVEQDPACITDAQGVRHTLDRTSPSGGMATVRITDPGVPAGRAFTVFVWLKAGPDSDFG